MSVHSSADRPDRISATTHGGLVAQFCRTRDRQHRQHGRGFGDCELINEVGEVRRFEMGNLGTNVYEAFIETGMYPFEKILEVLRRHGRYPPGENAPTD